MQGDEPVEVWVQVINVDGDDPHETDLEFLGEVKFSIEILECLLVPQDVTMMKYIAKNKKGKPQLEMVYNLATTEQAQGSRQGKFNLHITLVKDPKVQAKAWTEFLCTKDGVILTGTEAGFVPTVGTTDDIAVEVDIKQNTNVIPHILEEGMVLDDADIITESNHNSQLTGNFGINIHYRLTNRRITGKESVTVPAGTYEAYRLEYDTDASFSFTGKAGVMSIMRRQLEKAASGHNVLWLVEGVGWVKQEIESKAGKNTYELMEITR